MLTLKSPSARWLQRSDGDPTKVREKKPHVLYTTLGTEFDTKQRKIHKKLCEAQLSRPIKSPPPPKKKLQGGRFPFILSLFQVSRYLFIHSIYLDIS